MNTTRPSKWILLAAVAALPIVSSSAEAQYRVNQNGGALDANNRVGSGGVNTVAPSAGGAGAGNRIVTGNVTSGREFRWSSSSVLLPGGGISTRSQQPYVDSRDFRGGVAGTSGDQFIKNSVGVPGPNQGQIIPNRSDAFYGRRLAEAPPPGFAESGFTGTYTPVAAPLVAREQSLVRPQGGIVTSPFLTTPSVNELQLRLDDSIVAASPLLGLRQWKLDQPSNLNDPTANRLLENPLDRFRLDQLRPDQQQVLQMRDELYKAARDGRAQPTEDTPNNPQATDPSKVLGGELAKPLPTPFDAPENRVLGGKPIDAAVGGTPVPAYVRRDQSMVSRFSLPPTQQSSQYAELQRRLERYYDDRLKTDEQRHQDFLRQLQAKQAAEKAAQQQVVNNADPGGVPGAARPVMPDYGRIGRDLAEQGPPRPKAGDPSSPATAKPQPMQVRSLAEGVQAPGLARTLRAAEEQAKQGKFAESLQQYALAANVAPNNPLIWLGQAHAELGAGYYRRAEGNLRRALTADPSLLMGQYDLKGMLGQERLEFLVKDIKETAKAQPDDPGLVILLAYLAYNTGNAPTAAMWLDEVQKRLAAPDAPDATAYQSFIKLLRSHWVLPGDETGQVGPAAPALALSEVLKQFEEGNVASATLTNEQLRGEFRSAITIRGNKEPLKAFHTPLPPGAATGPLGKWIQEHSKGVNLKIQTTPPSK